MAGIGFDELLIGNRLGGLCFSSAGFTQRCDFLFRQCAELPRFHIECNTTIAGALDLLHMMADLFKHAAYLAVLTLRKRDLIPGIVGLAHQTHLCWSGPHRAHVFRARLAADADSLTQLFNVIFLRQSRDLHQICLGHVRSGAGKKVRQLAVIGHEQQALAGIVKAADGIYALAHVFDQAHHCGPAFGIRDCGDVSFGLVYQKVDVLFSAMKQLAIHFDMVAGQISFGAELGDDLSVDGDATLRNQFFGFAA